MFYGVRNIYSWTHSVSSRLFPSELKKLKKKNLSREVWRPEPLIVNPTLWGLMVVLTLNRAQPTMMITGSDAGGNLTEEMACLVPLRH